VQGSRAAFSEQRPSRFTCAPCDLRSAPRAAPPPGPRAAAQRQGPAASAKQRAMGPAAGPAPSWTAGSGERNPPPRRGTSLQGEGGGVEMEISEDLRSGYRIQAKRLHCEALCEVFSQGDGSVPTTSIKAPAAMASSCQPAGLRGKSMPSLINSGKVVAHISTSLDVCHELRRGSASWVPGTRAAFPCSQGVGRGRGSVRG